MKLLHFIPCVYNISQIISWMASKFRYTCSDHQGTREQKTICRILLLHINTIFLIIYIHKNETITLVGTCAITGGEAYWWVCLSRHKTFNLRCIQLLQAMVHWVYFHFDISFYVTRYVTSLLKSCRVLHFSSML